MGTTAKQLQNRFFLITTAFTAATAWLAGSADADAIPSTTAAAASTPGIAYAASLGGNAAEAQVVLFVGGVLLVTALCFGWLIYLMLSAPAEEGQEPTEQKGEPGPSLGQALLRSLRGRIGDRLGHAGPM